MNMGIYIKGMEMPKNCFDCPLFDDVYTNADGDDDYICGLGVPLDYYQASGKTKKDCLLIPVPPHGDLIDRDALNYTMLYKENWMHGTGVEAPAIWKSDIDAAPIIIEADESDMDSFIRIFEEDDEEDGMDSFIRILKD